MKTSLQAIKGIAWNSFGTIGAGLINLLITIVLARMLTPEDFGIIALLMVFQVLSDVITDSGFSQAIIRAKEINQTSLTTIFYINLVVAIILYVILFMVSPFISSFYGEPKMTNLCRVLFLSIIFNSIGLVQNSLFARNVNFKSPAISSIVAMIIAGVISVFLAFSGLGIWVLVANSVLYSLLKTLFLWQQSKWRPSYTFDFSSVSEYFKFGGNLLVQGFVDKLVTNIEPLLIGKFYTKSELGYYSQSSKINSYVSATSSSVIQRVTYPILSRYQDDLEKLKFGYKKIISWIAFFFFPLYTIMIIAPKSIMSVLFGDQWIAAASFLRLWSLNGLSLVFYVNFINVFLVLGESRKYLYLSLLKQVLKIATVLLTIRISIFALMIGITIITWVTGLIYIYFGGKLIAYSLLDFFKDVLQPALGCFVVFLISLAIKLFGNVRLVFDFWGLLLISISVVILFLMFMLIMGNNNVKEVKHVILLKIKAL